MKGAPGKLGPAAQKKLSLPGLTPSKKQQTPLVDLRSWPSVALCSSQEYWITNVPRCSMGKTAELDQNPHRRTLHQDGTPSHTALGSASCVSLGSFFKASLRDWSSCRPDVRTTRLITGSLPPNLASEGCTRSHAVFECLPVHNGLEALRPAPSPRQDKHFSINMLACHGLLSCSMSAKR